MARRVPLNVRAIQRTVPLIRRNVLNAPAVGAVSCAVGACAGPDGHRNPQAATTTGHPISNCAAVDSATVAAPPPSRTPDPQAPVNITGFNDYTAVRPCDYPGPTHYGWSSTRFKTTDSVHCDLYDPGSFQAYSVITCWGQLPGVPDDMNAVTVSPGAAATFSYIDVSTMETHHMGTGGDIPVDPGSYRELERGNKIVIPGAHGGSSDDRNDEICAVGHDQSLTCEIQNPEQSHGDNKIHGFYLSEQGSRVY